MIEQAKYFVHESACVDQPCEIGEGTKIWHFSHICAHSRIGRNCSLGQNVYVGPRVSIGNNVKIQNNVSVYEGVELQDDVFCGPSMVFTNVNTPRSGHPRNHPEDYQRTLLKRGASVGANATIVCGHTIGEHAFVGAGAVVTKDVPPYALVVGNPASIKGFSCECGQRLVFAGDASTCLQCARAYVKSGTNVHKVAGQ